MRLIDADKLEKKAQWLRGKSIEYKAVTVCDIRKAPTIDAALVVHGRWVLASETLNSNGGHTHKCGICEDYYTTEASDLFYCPRCGAVMDEIEHPDKYGWLHDFVDGEWKRVWGIVKDAYVEQRDVPQRGAYDHMGARRDDHGK